ncbi:MAG TPA: replication-associated recombination protein A [Candidatus Dojkabacteria bacterium]|nr:replication-associated recombination protein A [Candidatus Dojkabacteria bacterium]
MDNSKMEPLASVARPETFDDFIGQKHLIGEKGTLLILINKGILPSMIFWGPPGTGKTTLAYIISKQLDYNFYKLQAVSSGKANLKNILRKAIADQKEGKKSILFLDEIHRWNKAQQDALLPFVEKGVITLIGATTENPSFSINSALLSRTKVIKFEQLSDEEIAQGLERIVKKYCSEYKIDSDVIKAISQLANGDFRSAINILEIAITLADKNKKVTKEIILQIVQKQLYYDKNGEEHYNIISALHKSMRSSDKNASAYWTMRMIEAGEDPLYIARRMMRFASEDIGNADPQALVLANACYNACKNMGYPECDVILIQTAIYLASCPKDNSAYKVVQQTREDIKKFGNLQVPMHIRNGVTKMMQEFGYGKGYIYDHDTEDKKSGQQCMPDELKDRNYF